MEFRLNQRYGHLCTTGVLAILRDFLVISQEFPHFSRILVLELLKDLFQKPELLFFFFFFGCSLLVFNLPLSASRLFHP